MAQARSAIRFARDSTGRSWYPEHITEHSGLPTADLHCGGCTASVTAFRETTLRTNTIRSAHFKLKASRDGLVNTHDPDCTFHLQAAVANLLRDTRTVSYSRTRRRWQIAFPDDVTGPTPVKRKPGRTDPATGTGTSFRGHTTDPRQRLALLNDVHRVVTLLHQHRDDAAAANLFEGVWRGAVIGWADLYYPPDRHQALIQRIRGGVERRVDQPIAVSGQITSSVPPADGRPHRTLYLALRRDTRADRVNLVVRGTPDLLPDLPVDDAVVVLTRWGMWAPPAGSRRVEYCTGWLNWPHQITTVDPDLLDP